MATQAEVKAKLAKLDVNMDRFNAIVNGPASGPTSTVTTDNGPVRTLARVLLELIAEGDFSEALAGKADQDDLEALAALVLEKASAADLALIAEELTNKASIDDPRFDATTAVDQAILTAAITDKPAFRTAIGAASVDDPRFGSGGGSGSGGIGIRLEGAAGNALLYGDVGTDDSASLQAAVNAAITSNLPLILTKRHRINSTIVADLTNVDLSRLRIEGTGQGQAGLVFGNNAQIIINADHAASEYMGPLTHFSDFSIRTVGQSTTSPIRINYTGGSGGTGVAGIFANLDITGINPSSGFKYGIEGYNLRNTVFRDVRILGDRGVIDSNPGSKAVLSQGGIYCGGDSDPVDITFDNVEVYYVQKAFTLAGGFEGATFLGCTVVNTDIGIEDRRGSGVADPLITVKGSHFNTWSYGIVGENRFQSIISGNLFYNFGNYPGWCGIRMHNSIGVNSATSLSDNVFFVFSANATGIHVSGSTGVDDFIIDSNAFGGVVPMQNGVWLGEGADGVIVTASNSFQADTVVPIGGPGIANCRVQQDLVNNGSGKVTLRGGSTHPNKLTVQLFEVYASIIPNANGVRALGADGLRWSTVYAVDGNFSGPVSASGYATTSDARKKVEIEGAAAPELLAAIRAIKLRNYRLTTDEDGLIRSGIFAQDVIAAYDGAGLDWRKWSVVREAEDGGLSVVYDEFFVLRLMATEE